LTQRQLPLQIRNLFPLLGDLFSLSADQLLFFGQLQPQSFVFPFQISRLSVAGLRTHPPYSSRSTSICPAKSPTVPELLPNFKGVLVSDFYSAYDSMDCPQQKENVYHTAKSDYGGGADGRACRA
jgi:hypothetical protein